MLWSRRRLRRNRMVSDSDAESVDSDHAFSANEDDEDDESEIEPSSPGLRKSSRLAADRKSALEEMSAFKRRRLRHSERTPAKKPIVSVSTVADSILVAIKLNPSKLAKATGQLQTQQLQQKSSRQTFLNTFLNNDVNSIFDEESNSEDETPFRGLLTGPAASTEESRPTSEDMTFFADAHKSLTQSPVSADGIKSVRFGSHEIDVWYRSPYPEEYATKPVLHICEFCLQYMSDEHTSERHGVKCSFTCPPGTEIYRADGISIFEVDGMKAPQYCQSLCLLSKLFLDSKTLYYDVEPFMFYVLTENDQHGNHFVGYFSKQKLHLQNIVQQMEQVYNVSCILTLPHVQRKGYGSFLISFSYLLSRREKAAGTPEKPLSSLGLASYTNYWKIAICYYLRDTKLSNAKSLTLENISEKTGMTLNDVVLALELLGFLYRRSPSADIDLSRPRGALYAIVVNTSVLERIIARWESKGYKQPLEEFLVWIPSGSGASISEIESRNEDEAAESAQDASDENVPSVEDYERAPPPRRSTIPVRLKTSARSSHRAAGRASGLSSSRQRGRPPGRSPSAASRPSSRGAQRAPLAPLVRDATLAASPARAPVLVARPPGRGRLRVSERAVANGGVEKPRVPRLILKPRGVLQNSPGEANGARHERRTAGAATAGSHGDRNVDRRGESAADQQQAKKLAYDMKISLADALKMIGEFGERSDRRLRRR